MEYSTIIDGTLPVPAQDGISTTSILKKDCGAILHLAFNAGQELKEHKAPYDVLITALKGEADISIEEKTLLLKQGQSVIFPANTLHAVKARDEFRMQLVVIKNPA